MENKAKEISSERRRSAIKTGNIQQKTYRIARSPCPCLRSCSFFDLILLFAEDFEGKRRENVDFALPISSSGAERTPVDRRNDSVIKANNRTVEPLTCLCHVEGRAMSSSRRSRAARHPNQHPKRREALEGGRESERWSVVRPNGAQTKQTTAPSMLTCLRHVKGRAMSSSRRYRSAGSQSQQPKRRETLEGGKESERRSVNALKRLRNQSRQPQSRNAYLSTLCPRPSLSSRPSVVKGKAVLASIKGRGQSSRGYRCSVIVLEGGRAWRGVDERRSVVEGEGGS